MEKGLVQVYTGDGKGKTTAAIGQGIRAVGRGNKVYMLQFLKGGETGELETIKRIHPDFQIFRFEKSRNFVWNLNEEELKELKEEIQEAFDFAQKVLENGECDILILDEVMGVISNKLYPLENIIEIIKSRNEKIEVVLTGRNVPDEIKEIADYVSEVKCIKHPFEKGVPARKGIEF